MYLPAAHNAASAFSISSQLFLRTDGAGPADGQPPGGEHPDTEQWSSFIGIITAIVGNVLISFALNTQRYAHTRLERKNKEQRRARAAAEDGENGGNAYEAQRNGRATKLKGGRRPAANGDSHRDYDEEEDPTETDALLPARGSDRRSSATADNEDEGDDHIPAQSYLHSPYWWMGIILMVIGEAGNFLAYGFAPASIVSPLGVVALVSNCIIAPFMLKEPFRRRDFFGVLIAVGGAVTVVLSANTTDPKLGPDELWDLVNRLEFKIYLVITTVVILGLMWMSAHHGQKSIFVDLGLVGLFGGYTALSTKGVASLFSYTLFRALTFPMTYLLVFVLVFTAIMQIRYVNRALQRFDATQVIPTQFVMFTLSVIIGSAILYRDFENTSGKSAGKFVGGCALTFLGVWFITSAREPRQDEGFGFESAEEIINLAPDSRRSSLQQQRERESIRHAPYASLPMSLGTPTRSRASAHPHLIGHSGALAASPATTIEEMSVETLRPRTPPSTASSSSDVGFPSSVSSAGSVPTIRPAAAGSLDGPSPLSDNSWTHDAPRTSTAKPSKPLHHLTTLFSTPITLPPLEPTRTAPAALPHSANHTIHHPSTNEPHHHPHASIADLLRAAPQPLTAPLSSSLRVVVADELRRSTRRLSTRDGRLSAPATPSTAGSRSRGVSDASVLGAVEREEDGATAVRRRGGRGWVLGGLWGSLRGHRAGTADVEADPAEEAR